MGDYTPVHIPGNEITLQASATIVGGQLLMVSGNGTVAPATQAGQEAYIGVAAHDAVSGQKITVFTGVGIVHESVAQGAVTAGMALQVGSVAGTVADQAAGVAETLGIAIIGAADTGTVRWKAIR